MKMCSIFVQRKTDFMKVLRVQDMNELLLYHSG